MQTENLLQVGGRSEYSVSDGLNTLKEELKKTRIY